MQAYLLPQFELATICRLLQRQLNSLGNVSENTVSAAPRDPSVGWNIRLKSSECRLRLLYLEFLSRIQF